MLNVRQVPGWPAVYSLLWKATRPLDARWWRSGGQRERALTSSARPARDGTCASSSLANLRELARLAPDIIRRDAEGVEVPERV
jgi:hypothetical protein